MNALYKKCSCLLSAGQKDVCLNIGLLLIRLAAGGMMVYGHGFGKLTGFTEKASQFPDPLGIGASASLALATGAEFFCALAVIFGLFTRLACVPLIITMSVAGFIFHAADPFQNKELAFLYLSVFTMLLLTGPGKYSVDGALTPGPVASVG